MTRPILCFGEALIDFHSEGRDDRGFARAYVPFAGGAPANVAVAVAQLGGSARFAGMIGRDRLGDFLVDSLQQAGVATDDVVRTSEANTALAFVSLDEHGERSFSFYRPPAADLLFRAHHFRAQTFEQPAVFHVCSNSLTDTELAATTLEGMERAHRAGALVSIDLNLRPALWPSDRDVHAQVWPALLHAHLVKLSADEFNWLAVDGHQAALEKLWTGRPRLLIVTDGEKPMRWFHRDAEGELPAYAVDAVDTTAAGDSFVGGLLCQLAAGAPGPDQLDQLVGTLPLLHKTLRYAAACGALTVTRKGSFSAMPSDTEARRFMQARA
jgi:fructokinase